MSALQTLPGVLNPIIVYGATYERFLNLQVDGSPLDLTNLAAATYEIESFAGVPVVAFTVTVNGAATNGNLKVFMDESVTGAIPLTGLFPASDESTRIAPLGAAMLKLTFDVVEDNDVHYWLDGTAFIYRTNH